MLRQPFSSQEEAWLCLLHLHRTKITSPFPYFQSPFPTLPIPQLYPITTLSPSVGRSGFEICSPISLLGCLMNKSFLYCQPQHLSVCLAMCLSGKQAWFGDTISAFLFILIFHCEIFQKRESRRHDMRMAVAD